MKYWPKHRARAASITVAIALAACGGGDDDADTSTTLGSGVAQLIADAGGITVDGEDVPTNSTRAVDLDQQIALADEARGLVVLDDVEFELYMATAMRIVAADRLEVRAFLDGGHVTASLDEGTDARVRLETASGKVLTTCEPGTEFTVCQSPDGTVTCLSVVRGEVEWQSAGETKTYVAGESTFGEKGDPPQVAKCVPSDAFDQWFAQARRNETTVALGDLVRGSPECAAGAPSTTAPNGGETPQARIVPGTVAWTDTGIDVRSGDRIRIEAGGEIRAAHERAAIGPDGEHDPNLRVDNLPELSGANHAALIGRIGDSGPPFLVGSVLQGSADRDGRLFLGINDVGVDNNSGAYDATISVSTAPSEPKAASSVPATSRTTLPSAATSSTIAVPTTPSPTTVDPIAATKAAIAAAIPQTRVAYNYAIRNYDAPDVLDVLARSVIRDGDSWNVVIQNMNTFRANGQLARPNPQIQDTATAEGEIEPLDGPPATRAEATVCTISSDIVYTPAAAPGASEVIISDQVNVYRDRVTMVLEDGVWKIEKGTNLGAWTGVAECPPA